MQRNFKKLYKVVQAAIYFTNIRHILIGLVGKAFKKCLPSWTFLDLDFFRLLVFKVTTDVGLAEQNDSARNAKRIYNTSELDVYEAAIRRQ